MNAEIALLLVQDGLTNGAIYALLALALVLVFAVTRVLLVPQGEFVTYGALTLAVLQEGQVPGTAWLAVGLGAAAMTMEMIGAMKARSGAGLVRAALIYLVAPLAAFALVWWLAPTRPPLAIKVLLAVALVTPLGASVYRLAFQPLGHASILVLLFAAVAVHYGLMGLGLMFFGAEGWRTEAFTRVSFDAGPLTLSGQSLWIASVSVLLIVLLWLFFGRTLWGKALRATSLNRVGARLVGVSPHAAGKLAFSLAACLGAVSGALIAPITTIYYDSGFLIALKGFVGAVIGGLASYPLAAVGALSVGLVESYASFYASALKEVIVFGLLLPVLLWRSLHVRHRIEEAEEDA